jgi:hypothetical protein
MFLLYWMNLKWFVKCPWYIVIYCHGIYQRRLTKTTEKFSQTSRWHVSVQFIAPTNYNEDSSSSSIGTTTLSWVSACSTIVENSQQEGFTECRFQRHVIPPTWRRTSDLERSYFRHKRPPASEATLANQAAEGGTMGEKWPREFCRKWRLPRHVRILLHAVKRDMGQTALLPLRRKACWGFFRPKNPKSSAGFEPANLGTKGQHATSRPPKPLQWRLLNSILYRREMWQYSGRLEVSAEMRQGKR